ncbi:hypothetical protein H9Q69_011027 [Fusarium xylarioides]|uniref:Uncharacterized protein n=1 Tax=Fusarium xylarioides TaxID=221167 RepID=A0A9P7HG10_9HYPO|nr:hypothetical protein H9Q72_012950 [Fusarium xylarioides]KAG5789919.1 hypothetical protein H9Q69_011027 [Fusarium xylarioides]
MSSSPGRSALRDISNILPRAKTKRKRMARQIIDDDTDSDNTPAPVHLPTKPLPSDATCSDTDSDTPLVPRIRKKRIANQHSNPKHSVDDAVRSLEDDGTWSPPQAQNYSFNSDTDGEGSVIIHVYEVVDLAEGIQGTRGLRDEDDSEDDDNPEKEVTNGTARHWVTRLLAITQEPPNNIAPYLMPGVSLPVVQANQRLFQSTVTSMVERAQKYAMTQELSVIRVKDFKERALSVGFWNLFKRLQVAEMTKPFFGSMAPEVKSLLGRKDLQPAELLDLPRVDDHFRLWGVYVNIVTDKFGRVRGLYIGSSVAYKTYIGITGRVRGHLANAMKPFDSLSTAQKSEHYRFLSQPGMSSNFRTLALFKIEANNTAHTVLAEAILMSFLSTVKVSSEQQVFLEVLRQDLPGVQDFSAIGLNRSIPLAYGYRGMPVSHTLHQTWLKENDLEDVCMNCGRHAPDDDKDWGGWFSKRRCRACLSWRNAHGHEKQPREFVSLTDHQLFWVDMGHPDVCQNPLCGEPRRPGRNVFRGFGPESRCVACYKHRIKYGEEDPSPHSGKPFAKHQEWLDQGNHDVYGTCRELRPDESHLLGWTGWLDASKCARCTKNARPTNDDDAAWVEEHGDTCALCGVDRIYTNLIHGRAANRRCLSCFQYKQKHKHDKPPAEITYGDKSVHAQWVAQGNRDVCCECGRARTKTNFYGWRDKAKCRACYRRALKAGNRVLRRNTKKKQKGVSGG